MMANSNARLRLVVATATLDELAEIIDDQAGVIDGLSEVVQRLREDRRILLEAHRQHVMGSPLTEPVDFTDFESDEHFGHARARWEAGAVSREAIARVGATLEVRL